MSERPIGIRPIYYLLEDRAQDLHSAIGRYLIDPRDMKNPIVLAWAKELVWILEHAQKAREALQPQP